MLSPLVGNYFLVTTKKYYSYRSLGVPINQGKVSVAVLDWYLKWE